MHLRKIINVSKRSFYENCKSTRLSEIITELFPSNMISIWCMWGVCVSVCLCIGVFVLTCVYINLCVHLCASWAIYFLIYISYIFKPKIYHEPMYRLLNIISIMLVLMITPIPLYDRPTFIQPPWCYHWRFNLFAFSFFAI